jgi:hypothetical protein
MARHLARLVIAIGVVLPSCAPRRVPFPDYGIPACAPGAERDLLSSEALQCWFTGAHGRWRVLGHQSHLQALVVEAHAQDLREAEGITARVVASPEAAGYTEVLVYVRREAPGGGARVARVRWTPTAGAETVVFEMPAEDTALRTQVREVPGGEPN